MRKPPLPLPVPHTPLRRPLIATGGIGLALLGASAALDFAIEPAPRVIWNASASAPVGLWRVHPGAPIRTGDMVLVRTPASVRRLAAARHYLPSNVPLLKRVAAHDGEEVCALGPHIFVNGRPVAARRTVDRKGRALPWWHGCERLRGGRLFLLTDAPESFDGRYFGPVDQDAVIGRATPLWLR